MKKFYSTAMTALLISLTHTPTSFADDEIVQPSVARKIVVCDSWQWIGGDATTWGCLYTPRAAEVAAGQAADQVIASLQAQINALEARLKKLEQQ